MSSNRYVVKIISHLKIWALNYNRQLWQDLWQTFSYLSQSDNNIRTAVGERRSVGFFSPHCNLPWISHRVVNFAKSHDQSICSPLSLCRAGFQNVKQVFPALLGGVGSAPMVAWRNRKVLARYYARESYPQSPKKHKTCFGISKTSLTTQGLFFHLKLLRSIFSCFEVCRIATHTSKMRSHPKHLNQKWL